MRRRSAGLDRSRSESVEEDAGAAVPAAPLLLLLLELDEVEVTRVDILNFIYC